MILGDMVHTLPAQAVIFEGELTLADNETFATDWFDSVHLHPEDVLNPQTGTKVGSVGGFPDDGSGFRFIGLYEVDLAVHENNAVLARPQTVLRVFAWESMPPDLMALPASASRIVGDYHLLATASHPWRWSLRVMTRFFRVQVVAPGDNGPHTIRLSALARSL